jgi:hypothetical protein
VERDLDINKNSKDRSVILVTALVDTLFHSQIHH